MSTYPWVVVLRWDEYSEYDRVLNEEKRCTLKITSDIQDIKLLYNEHWNVLVTFGKSWTEYVYKIQSLMITKIFQKWIHILPEDIEHLYDRSIACYIGNLPKRETFRPKISCFTTSFKSGHKILRPYRTLLSQTLLDWEWVVLDDTPGDENWQMLIEQLKDPRVRLYKRSCNSGSIGNVKNEASSLCRGKYLLELDHDDELMPDCLEQTVKGFESDKEIAFVYMDFCELFEDWRPFKYGEGWGYGFGSYYLQYLPYSEQDGKKRLDHTSQMGSWQYVARSCDINNMTTSDIIGVPNHPRAWRKDVLHEIGYSEAMPIADDYELLVQTVLKYKILRIPRLGYLQYRNDGNNNFSMIRNWEITKIQRLVGKYYQQDIWRFFRKDGKELVPSGGPFWARDNAQECNDVKINKVTNFSYDTTVGIINNANILTTETFINDYYNKQNCDIIFITNNEGAEPLIDALGLTRIKFYVLTDFTVEQLKKYFFNCYLSTPNHVLFE